MGQRIKDQIIFPGSGLDTDTNIHYLKKGDTDQRWNLIPSGEGNNYVLTIVKGNHEISNAHINLGRFMINPVVVGSCYDTSKNMFYYFLCDDNNLHSILRYNIDKDVIERVLVPSIEFDYGRLYNWYAIDGDIAPDGWHVPTVEEWEELIANTGGVDNAGKNLKDIGARHWFSPNIRGNNQYGFSAHAAGIRGDDEYGEFLSAGKIAVFWTADDEDQDFAFGCRLAFNSPFATISSSFSKKMGCSLRLIRDDLDGWSEGEVVTDADGNTYNTVRIGDQVWMTSNFACTKYSDGSDIDFAMTEAEWFDLNDNENGAYSVYENKLFYVRLTHFFNNLGLSKDVLIDDAAVLDDFLFWNPKTSSPRMIKISWALNLMEYLYRDNTVPYNKGDLFYYKGRVFIVEENGISEPEIIESIENIVIDDSIIPVPPEPAHVISAIVNNNTHDKIRITFSKDLDDSSVPDNSAFTVTGKTIDSIDVAGDNDNEVVITVTEPFVYNETANVSYVKPVSDPLKDIEDNIISDFNIAVKNDVLEKPVPDYGMVTYDNKDKIIIVFDLPLDDQNIPDDSNFSITPNKTITNISIEYNVLTIKVNSSFSGTDEISVSYSKNSPAFITGLNSAIVDEFTNLIIENQITVPYELSLKPPVLFIKDYITNEISGINVAIKNIAPQANGQTYTGKFRVLFKCYIAPDGIEYISMYGYSDTITINADELKSVSMIFDSSITNVNYNKQHEVTVSYDKGGGNWELLYSKIWNKGM